MTGRDCYNSIVWETDPKTQGDLSICPDYGSGFAVCHYWIVANVDRSHPNTILPVVLHPFNNPQLTNFSIDSVYTGEMGAMFYTCYKTDFAVAIHSYTVKNPTHRLYVMGRRAYCW